MERHAGPIREKWAGQTSLQDERSHVGQRSPGIESSMTSLVLCDSLKKAFYKSYSPDEHADFMSCHELRIN
jgi:hypothetical protein